MQDMGINKDIFFNKTFLYFITKYAIREVLLHLHLFIHGITHFVSIWFKMEPNFVQEASKMELACRKIVIFVYPIVLTIVTVELRPLLPNRTWCRQRTAFDCSPSP